MHSRLMYMALIPEVTENAYLKPTTFVPIIASDVMADYKTVDSSPILGSRMLNINPIKDQIDAPKGKISVQIEPKTWGHFMKGIYGAVTSGRWFQIELRLAAGTTTGTPQAGATLSQAVTLATATINSLVSGNAYYAVRSVTVGFNASNLVTGTNPDGTTFTFTPSATLPVPNWTVGETVTGGTSAATAAIIAVSSENDYLLMGAPTGTFTAAGEAITGGTSSTKSTLLANASTVYGHQFFAPQSNLPTYTIEFGYENEAYRIGGTRFRALGQVSPVDNIITAEIEVLARSEFLCARVQAAVSAGAGAKTITLDQTTGLIAADVIKVFRPRTDSYIDFASAGVKTHAVGTIPSETSITITNLEVALEAGDLIVLAPQTPSYTLSSEFPWIGGSLATIGDTMVAALGASAGNIEDFKLSLMSEYEEKHAANGINLVNRFPSSNLPKTFSGNGSIKRSYVDPKLADRARNKTETAIRVLHYGDVITSTVRFLLDWRTNRATFDSYRPKIEKDNILEEEVSYKIYRDSATGYAHKAVLVNTTASY